MASIEQELRHPTAAVGVALELEAPSPRAVMRRRAMTHVGFLTGGAIVLGIILVAIFAPLLTSYDPFAQDLTKRLIPPVWSAKGSWAHILGTDGLGRDYLTRLMYGARISLMVGLGAATMAGLIGTTLGLIGGYFGGKIDAVVMYIVNVKLALPGILVALSLVFVFGGSVTAIVFIVSYFASLARRLLLGKRAKYAGLNNALVQDDSPSPDSGAANSNLRLRAKK